MHVSSLRLPEPSARRNSDHDDSSLVEVLKDGEDSQPVFSPTSSQISHFSLLSSDVDINASVSSDAQYVEVCEQPENALEEKEGLYSKYTESVASGPGESITGYKEEPRHSYSISQRLGGPKVETTPPAIEADHLAAPPVPGSRSQVDNVQPWLQSVSQYHSYIPSGRASYYISLSEVGKAEEKPGDLHVDELRPDIKAGIPSEVFSSILVDTEDASIAISHLANSGLSDLPDDQLSFSTALDLPKTSAEEDDSDIAIRPDSSQKGEPDSDTAKHPKQDDDFARRLDLQEPPPAQCQDPSWRKTFGIPKPIVALFTILTALSFVLDMIPKVVEPPIDYQTPASILAADIIVSTPKAEPSLALHACIPQASLSHVGELPSQSQDSGDSLSTTAVFLLLAFVSVYSIIRNLFAKSTPVDTNAVAALAHCRSSNSRRKVRIRTVSPAITSSLTPSLKSKEVQDALLASRKRPSPIKAEAVEPSSPPAVLQLTASPTKDTKKAITKPISRSPSPALTETPTKQKLRNTSITPGSDRVTRSMTRARLASTSMEASSPTTKAASKAKSRKQVAILSDSGTEQPADDSVAEDPAIEKATRIPGKRSVSAPRSAGAGCTFHIVTVSGASGSGKTSLIMQQTEQRIPQTPREKEKFEHEHQARVNLFEKGQQRNKLVYRKAGVAPEEWDLSNPEYSERGAESPAGLQVKMIVYDLNDPISFTRAHEEAVQYLRYSIDSDSLICLVANKCDLLAGDDMPQRIEQAKQTSLHWLRAQQIPPALSRERVNWFAVSAASGQGVMPMFREIARILRTPKKVEVEPMDVDRPEPQIIVID